MKTVKKIIKGMITCIGFILLVCVISTVATVETSNTIGLIEAIIKCIAYSLVAGLCFKLVGATKEHQSWR